MTILTDSVLLGGAPAVRGARPCWRVATVGRPFLGIRDAADELGARRPGPVAAISLGYRLSR